MPNFTFVHYDGSDEQIMKLVSQLVAANDRGQLPPTPKGNGNAGMTSSSFSEVTTKFAQYVNDAAAYGKPGQQKAMLAWLNADGEILLVKLWKAAGVSTQHDYSGVGGSLTKNMIKAGGPRDWYTCSLNHDGEWVYKILPELVEPLKQAFGLK
ncbi:MAG: hypothetical protein ABSF46_13170 [Terriglobia bacterium]|jgi:hypothetical protein